MNREGGRIAKKKRSGVSFRAALYTGNQGVLSALSTGAEALTTRGAFPFGNPKTTKSKLQSLEGAKNSLSNEKRAPGWLGYIGDDTTQLYRDYNKPFKDPDPY